MHTEILSITTVAEQTVAIARAVELLRSGDIVAFPTETVYGLGANAYDDNAVHRIFAAKGRPSDNPLIVHIAEDRQLLGVASTVPAAALKLSEQFWPGPLSLIVPAHANLSPTATAGLSTVAIRMPEHPLARSLIKAARVPIAAPSANRSGRVSPTTAAHVAADLSGRIPLIIDGGAVAYGLESTVVDCTASPPVVLRPGSITLNMLRTVIPEIRAAASDAPIRSPGMKYTHYATTAPITLFVGAPADTAAAVHSYLQDHSTKKVALLWHSGNFEPRHLHVQLPAHPHAAAPRLFAALRTLDEHHPEEIVVQGYPQKDIGTAIMNRLSKAATSVIHA